MHASDWIAFWALVVAVISLGVAIYAIRKGNRNSSVATFVTLSDQSREAWKRFLTAADEETKWSELCELMNLLEIASAILNEKSFAGASKKLLKDYLDEALALLIGNEDAKAAVEKMFSAETTFEHIRKFYNEKRPQPLSITSPKQWFQH